jgi:hypothetical protein
MVALSGTLLFVHQFRAAEHPSALHPSFFSLEVILAFFQNKLLMSFLISSWCFVKHLVD